MKRIMRIIILNLLILWNILVRAEIHIEITKGADSARPIGIIPFQRIGQQVISEDISNIIAADLRNSGKFNPLYCHFYPQQKPNNNFNTNSKTCSDLGITIIVIGQVILNVDNSYDVSYQLIDTSSNKSDMILAKNSYKVGKQRLRYVGHTVSDKIFEKLTGIKGAFRTRIAYIAQTNNDKFPYELRISDYDGYNQFVIHRSPQLLMSPAWSPKGDKLAYVTFENNGHSALVIQTLSNGEIHRIASFPGHNGAPAFSPDGTKIAFALSKTGSLNLYVMDIASNFIHQITNERSNNTEPTWFPDSQNLAYTSDQTGHPQIFKININDGISQRITWKGLQNQNANISNDGKFMIMISLNNGQQYITKLDLLDGNTKVLSSTFLDETPSLAPNDTMAIYGSSQGIKSILNLISIDGHFKTIFPAIDGQVKFPAWSPYL